jgi:Na+/melibiose symporter-like transporter
METKLDIKTKFAIGSAVVAFLAGWGLTIAGFFITPKGEVHDSVLWILGQALIYAASVFGVGMYISSEMTKLRTENRRFIERTIREKEAEQDED